VVINGAVVSQVTIKEKIKAEFDRWWLVKLFRSTGFAFPEPVEIPWQYRE
jgi:hypothetical protein